MRKLVLLFITIATTIAAYNAKAQKLVILHTNDTHSYIDPSEKDEGSAFRRKVLIDSIRSVEPNVLLIDAGDAVQGTLYYHLYKGMAEHKIMNFLGYDIAVVGNHDFDNGVDNLAENLKIDSATWISTNYDLSDSKLEPYFDRYTIREIDGKKIGFIGLNLNPKGMIADGNYDGVVYQDIIEAANATAWHLKHNEHVDKVVAITHIGYSDPKLTDDVDLAQSSKDIDLIIGGHSHSLIDPTNPESDGEWKIANANGDSIPVVQTYKWGQYLGKITIDLNSDDISYQLIPVHSRLDTYIKPEWKDVVAAYRHGVDSLMNLNVGKISKRLEQDSPALLNLVTDIIKRRGDEINGSPVDLAIGNKGGIRCALPKGNISEGRLITMLPFTNRITILDIKGSDLKEAFDVMVGRGGDGVSNGVRIKMANKKASDIYINGVPLNPDRIYRIATIDYLANGGDYMEPLTKGAIVAQSENLVYNDAINYFKNTPRRKRIKIDDTARMHE